VPEAQDDFMEERVFASGMKTDDWVFHLHHQRSTTNI
jgi:hypothetical protein